MGHDSNDIKPELNWILGHEVEFDSCPNEVGFPISFASIFALLTGVE